MFTLPIIENYLKTYEAYNTARATVLEALTPEIHRRARSGRSDSEIYAYLVSLSVPEELIAILMEGEVKAK